MEKWLTNACVAFPFLLLACGAAAQERDTDSGTGTPAAGASLGTGSDWPLESVELRSGTVYRGLVRSESELEIEVMEVVRAPGKPMFLVIRPVPRRDVAEITRLPDEERQRLIGRTNRFRKRVLIEADRMDRIVLVPVVVNGVRRFRYEGNWFGAVSDADEETTRRCLVRIEQIFRAYRLVLPPRTTPRRPLEMLLFGSMDEYGDYLQSHGLSLENPSFYLARQNRIVAASELTRFSRHLAEARARHDQIQQTLEKLDADLPQRLRRLADQLKLQGYTRKEIVDELQAQKNAWSHRKTRLLAQIAETNRLNDNRFDELTRQMFRRLYHEALHAYLENYVYPDGPYRVPRWLNEGLAQTFESGQLDGDILRIDAPDRTALMAVKQRLASSEPPSLEELLWANETDFLTAHEEAGGPARQTYYLSWAVTYYLAFLSDHSIWGTAALDAFVTPDDRGLAPTVRFEQLVGMSLPKFENHWRIAMETLKPAPR